MRAYFGGMHDEHYKRLFVFPRMVEHLLLSPCQPSQRYVVDERHVEADDLPGLNLMTAVVRLEQSRSPADLAGVVKSLWEWRRSPHDNELMRVFAAWVRRLLTRLMPEEEEALPQVRTLEEVEMTLKGTGKPMADRTRPRAGRCFWRRPRWLRSRRCPMRCLT